jgi:hypothetical protein
MVTLVLYTLRLNVHEVEPFGGVMHFSARSFIGASVALDGPA